MKQSAFPNALMIALRHGREIGCICMVHTPAVAYLIACFFCDPGIFPGLLPCMQFPGERVFESYVFHVAHDCYSHLVHLLGMQVWQALLPQAAMQAVCACAGLMTQALTTAAWKPVTSRSRYSSMCLPASST